MGGGGTGKRSSERTVRRYKDDHKSIFVTKAKRRECFKKEDVVNCIEYCQEVKTNEGRNFTVDKARKLLVAPARAVSASW